MSENPGGNPPSDEEPVAPAAGQPAAATPEPAAAAPIVPVASPAPVEPPAPGAPSAPVAPPAPPAQLAPPAQVLPPAPPVPVPPAPAAPPAAEKPAAAAPPPTYPPAGGFPPPPAAGSATPPPGAYPPPPGSYPPPAQGSYPPPQGSYPPPSGAYPPPAQGAYPPPQGAYPPPQGSYPPPSGAYPPPPGGYAPAAPSPVGAAFSYGWTKFTQSGGAFVAATLIWFVVAAVVIGGISALLVAAFSAGDGLGRRFSFAFVLVWALFSLVVYLIEAAFIRVALAVTRGVPPQLAEFFRFENSRPIVLTVLLIAAINLVVSFVAWIPLIGWLISAAVSFLLFFTLWFVVDKRLEPVDAIRASIDLITKNLGVTLLFYVLALVALGVGAAVCFVGLLVAVPVVLVATAYLYRTLVREPIAP